MAAVPIYNVVVPYVGAISEGLSPGRIVRIHGTTPPSANRFSINLQCGPNTAPRDDIALHISVRFPENSVVRNSLHSMNWGPEETYGQNPLLRAQSFEIILLCDYDHYKIAVNGQHFTEFVHRIPYQRVSHLTIDGDITVSMISYEGGSPGRHFAPPAPGSVGFVPPSAPGAVPYPPGGYSSVPTAYGVPPAPYPPASGPYQPASGPYPPSSGAYPPTSGAYPPTSGLYPTQPGYGYAQQPYSQGSYPAAGGTALGAGLAGAALTGHLSPKKAMKKQKKSHKKALKYGLPIAGAGLGAYALSRGLRGGFHGHSSSSSSSSSEEE